MRQNANQFHRGSPGINPPSPDLVDYRCDGAPWTGFWFWIAIALQRRVGRGTAGPLARRRLACKGLRRNTVLLRSVSRLATIGICGATFPGVGLIEETELWGRLKGVFHTYPAPMGHTPSRETNYLVLAVFIKRRFFVMPWFILASGHLSWVT